MQQNWEKVKEVFYEALSKSAFDRPAFLDEACSGDVEFRSQVELLLDSYRSGFLEDNVWPDVIGDQTKPQFEAGTRLGHYRIVRLLGRGGMGDVYEAIDLDLDRRVALKFLSEALRNDKSARRRFQKEAQAIAMLEHPNICAVYGIEHEGDDDFIVMQYVDGVPLNEALKTLEVDQEKFLAIARQITAAVAFAHDRGIIHRDLKPANIMLAEDGSVKVLDFGLAKVIEQKNNLGSSTPESLNLSTEGLIAGTIAYMSPEQLRGETLDYQTDIFSLGVIFYEVLAKTSPFQRKTKAETISAILNDDAFKNGADETRIDPAAVKLIGDCLQKDRQKRPPSTETLVRHFDQLQFGTNSTFSRRLSKALVAAGILCVCVLGSYFFDVPARATQAFRQKHTIAILPIAFEGAELEKSYLADDLTRSIVQKLSRTSNLTVVNASYTETDRKKLRAPRTAGLDLKADSVFTGTIESYANGLVLRTNIVRTADGNSIDSNELRVARTGQVGLAEGLAAHIVDKIGVNLNEADRIKLVRNETDSSEAKELYLLGLYYARQSKDGNQSHKAIEAFTSAKDLDPNYAKPWAGLAVAYLLQTSPGAKNSIPPSVAVDLSRKAAQKAIDLDPTLAEAYYALAQISVRYDWNWSDAEANDRTALSLDPQFLPAQIGLINVLRLQGRYDEALAEIVKISDIDPLSVSAERQRLLAYYYMREPQKTEAALQAAFQKAPNSQNLKYIQAYQLMITGRPQEAVDKLEPLYDSPKDEDKIMYAAPLGMAYGMAGTAAKAQAVIRDLEELGKKHYVPSQETGLIYVALGDMDNAFGFLQRSCAERYPTFPDLMNDPLIENLRADPRYLELRRCANL